jgi:hypothetical protein
MPTAILVENETLIKVEAEGNDALLADTGLQKNTQKMTDQ